ncbi:MAG TPA: hypothetical protein PLW35_06725, partial [Verrucomicrobiota bacterium]|nr:hypothetical protein [Verrucomicrobiota bacterium]
VEKATASGARPSSAASTRQPILRPVSIMQILRPNIQRLGMDKQRVCPHVGIRGVPPRTSAIAHWNRGQYTVHACVGAQNPNNPNNEPVTLFVSLLDVRVRQGGV